MLHLTDSANKRLVEWALPNGNDIRIKMATAGCTGLMYEVILCDDYNPLKDDIALDKLDLRIVVDSQYGGAISGATLDYITENFNSHFELVDNPNEKARCGCGESFSI